MNVIPIAQQSCSKSYCFILRNYSGSCPVWIVCDNQASSKPTHNASWLSLLLMTLYIKANCFDFIYNAARTFPVDGYDIPALLVG